MSHQHPLLSLSFSFMGWKEPLATREMGKMSVGPAGSSARDGEWR